MARKPLVPPTAPTPPVPAVIAPAEVTPEDDWTGDLDAAVPPPQYDPGLRKIAAAFGAFKPAREVLTQVRAMPTIFPQFDFKSRIGGLPLERFIVVHGPSSHGKTEFCLGLGLSFVRRNSFFNLVDAEMTTPFDWIVTDWGRHYAESPFLLAMRPRSYEETVASVRDTLTTLVAEKKKGNLHPDTSCLFVVDSLRKLVPEKLMEKIAAEKGGIDGASGRAAQMKAAMNSQWLDELIPALNKSGATMVVIARESENMKTNPWDADWKMTGGKAIEYDSSLILRISRTGYIKQGGDQSPVIGERHQIAIRKTKVSGKDEKEMKCYFHTSNGKAFPQGFDINRDLLELAMKFGVVNRQKGAWLGYSRWRAEGVNAFLSAMQSSTTLVEEIDRKVREQFSEQDPLRVEMDDGETV